MPTCVSDFTPIVLAIAGIITVQTPILVAALIKQFDAGRERRALQVTATETNNKVDKLTTITMNGFHGPPGKTGETGEKGEPGKDA